MSNELATTEQALEKVILKGDLSSLSPEERVNYYLQVCELAGLDPAAHPFDILQLSGKTVLYANKSASEQLRKRNTVSIDALDGKQVGDVYVVTVKGHDGTGRTDMATGAVTIGNAKGDALANLLMKCETKAKRRFTLSICGLGMLDETEVDTIPGAHTEKVVVPTGNVELDDPAAALAERQKEARNMVDDAQLDGLITREERDKAVEKYTPLSLPALEKWFKVFAQTIAERQAQKAQEDKQPVEDERIGSEPDVEAAFGQPPEEELF